MDKDYDLVVIGAGSGGISAANYAAKYGMKVAVIDAEDLGGTCVNLGCIPKKLMWYSAYCGMSLKEVDKLGWDKCKSQINWQHVKQNIHRTVKNIQKSYQSKITKNGIDFIIGTAKILDKNTISVDNKSIKSKFILIATGSSASKLDFAGSEHMLISDDIFNLDTLPKSICIIGAGYIAHEFASILHNLGCEVTIIHRNLEVLKNFDREFATKLQTIMQDQGIKFLLNTRVIKITQKDSSCEVYTDHNSQLNSDFVLCATGRKANLSVLSDDVGLDISDKQELVVDSNYCTSIKNIYAVGDVIATPKLTPIAIHQGVCAVQHMLNFENITKINYAVVPSTVFTLPQFSSVGLTEEQATKDYTIENLETSFKDLKSMYTQSDSQVSMKILCDKATGKVLGVHMIGGESSEIIQSLSVAVGMGMTLAQLAQTTALHPCVAEELIYLARRS